MSRRTKADLQRENDELRQQLAAKDRIIGDLTAATADLAKRLLLPPVYPQPFPSLPSPIAPVPAGPPQMPTPTPIVPLPWPQPHDGILCDQHYFEPIRCDGGGALVHRH